MTTEVDLSGSIDSPAAVHQNTTPSKQSDAWLPSSVEHFTIPAKATVVREWLSKRREGVQSWREFLKTDRFRLPKSPAVVLRRVSLNLDHFQSNYLCVFIVLMLYCVLTSPALLVALVFCAGLLYFLRVKIADRKLTLFGREFLPVYQYLAVAAVTFPLFYFAGAGSIVFWVIGASLFVIALHALFYASEPDPAREFLQMESV